MKITVWFCSFNLCLYDFPYNLYKFLAWNIIIRVYIRELLWVCMLVKKYRLINWMLMVDGNEMHHVALPFGWNMLASGICRSAVFFFLKVQWHLLFDLFVAYSPYLFFFSMENCCWSCPSANRSTVEDAWSFSVVPNHFCLSMLSVWFFSCCCDTKRNST